MTLWGSQGVGKTHLLIDLVAAIAGEHAEWLGNPVMEHGPVLYIVQEAEPMFLAACKKYPGYPDSLPTFTLGRGLVLRNEKDWEVLEAAVAAHLVTIIDPVTSVDWAVKVSDNDMVNTVMARLDRIAAKTGSAIILVLHRKKITQAESQFGSEDMETDSALGAIAWLAKASARYQLLKDKRTNLGLCLKPRPGKLPDTGPIKLRTDPNGFFLVRKEWKAGALVIDGEVVER